MKPKNCLQRSLDRTPPFLVYYMAHDSKAALSHPGPAAIAARSGLSEATVVRLSAKLSWAGVSVETVDALCNACQCSLVAEESTVVPHGDRHYRHTRYNVRRPHASYLQRVARGEYEHQLRHLSPMQRRRFDALSARAATG